MADTIDLSQLKGLLAQFQPTDEDRSAANSAMIMQLGATLMGTRKGQEWDRIGAALENGAAAKGAALSGAGEQRMRSMQQAATALGLLGQTASMQDQDLARKQQSEFLRRYGQPGALGLLDGSVQGGGNGGGMFPQGALPQSPMPVSGMSGPEKNRQAQITYQNETQTNDAAPAQAPSGRVVVATRSKRDQADAMRERGDYWLNMGRPERAQPYYTAAEKLTPQLKDQKTLTLNGQRVVVNVYNDGTHEVLPDVRPDQEKAHFLDTGSQVGAVDPFTGKPITGGGLYNKTMTPGEVATNDVARGNLAVNQGQLGVAQARERREAAKSNEPAWVNDLERGIQIDPRTGNTRSIMSGGQPLGTKADAKRTQQAGDALAILDIAEPLIKKATGSYIGNAADTVAQAVGGSPSGAIAGAQLEALQGALMMNQPRMEGPQSDKDTDLYRRMAGEIGNANVPAARKLAAVKVIRQLHSKYAGQQSQGADASRSPPSVGDLEAEMRRRGMAP